MSPQNSTAIPDADAQNAQQEIDQGVLAAYAAEDYLLATGRKDTTKIREHIMTVLKTAKVLNRKEREAKAVTRGSMVAQVFPSLTAPPFTDADDDQLALAIWTKVSSDVWNMLQPNATSAIQQLVGAAMGNGYWMCRTKVGVDAKDAVYVTDNLGCIEDDFLGPEARSLQRKVDLMVTNRTVLIGRRPEDAKRFLAQFTKQLDTLKLGGRSLLELAVEASQSNGTEAGEPGGDEPGSEAGETE